MTSSWGGARALPYAFTEEGVAMLSSVLRSGRAVQVNIAMMRAFVQLRQVLSSHLELARKLAELEQRIEGHDTAIRSLFDAIPLKPSESFYRLPRLDQRVWRYMDHWKFESLIKEKALYFRRSDRLEDDMEVSTPRLTVGGFFPPFQLRHCRTIPFLVECPP